MKVRRKTRRFPYLVVVLALLTWLGYRILSTWPGLAESWYGEMIYPGIRWTLDRLQWPIPAIYIMLTTLGGYLAYRLGYLIFHFRPFWSKVKATIRALSLLASVIVIWFYWIWGFNYARPDVSERLGLGHAQPDSIWLFDEINTVVNELNMLRANDDLDYLSNLSIDEIVNKPVPVDELNRELEQVLPSFKYGLRTWPKLNFLRPDGFLLHWSTSGIYWLFSGESNVDSGVHYLKKPVTVAHELAHAHGLTAEGDCNFVAYVACVNSQNIFHRYSAQLSYLGYLMSDASKLLGQDGLNRFYKNMSEELKNDRLAIYNHHKEYADYFPKLRNAFYDSYLKSQGVKQGMKSYNYFVNLKYLTDQQRLILKDE